MKSPIHQITNSPTSCVALFDAERLSAAACRRRVRVLDRESAARNRVDEVHFGAVQIADADRVDEQLHAVRLEDLIAGPLAVLFDHQAVLKTGASAALHEYAQAAAGLVLFAEQLVDLRSRRF